MADRDYADLAGRDMLLWVKRHKELVAIAVALVGVVVAIMAWVWPSSPPVLPPPKIVVINPPAPPPPKPPSQPKPIWYADRDGDGFGDPKKSREAKSQPDGFVQNAEDCFDHNPQARPGTEGYFEAHRGDGSFDYNCDGTSTRAQRGSGSCSNGTANQGWEGGVPACGKIGRWLVDCDRKVSIFPPKIKTIRETESRRQACR